MVTVLDSYVFFLTKLATLLKCMGINNVEKGYHPYLFTDIDYMEGIVSCDYFDLSDGIVLGKERLRCFMNNCIIIVRWM